MELDCEGIMKPFKRLSGSVIPLDRANVDTDQIIPKQFLKLIQRTGFGKYLFYDWRFDKDGKQKQEFILNNLEYQGAAILLTRKNFGTGSSREHAVWSLLDYGFRVIISSSFADIFYNNCFKNGVLAITLEEEEIDQLFLEINDKKKYVLKVDLESQTIITPENNEFNFLIDSFRKKTLLEGLDEITLTLQYKKLIKEYEEKKGII